jgi:hypothetical protein
VFTKLKKTLIGSKIWLTSGTRLEEIMAMAHKEEETIWKLEVQSVITLLRLQPLRNLGALKFSRQSKRRARLSLSGMAQSEETSRLQRTALLGAWPTRYSAIMLSYVEYIPQARSKSFWRRRPRDSS